MSTTHPHPRTRCGTLDSLSVVQRQLSSSRVAADKPPSHGRASRREPTPSDLDESPRESPDASVPPLTTDRAFGDRSRNQPRRPHAYTFDRPANRRTPTGEQRHAVDLASADRGHSNQRIDCSAGCASARASCGNGSSSARNFSAPGDASRCGSAPAGDVSCFPSSPRCGFSPSGCFADADSTGLLGR